MPDGLDAPTSVCEAHQDTFEMQGALCVGNQFKQLRRERIDSWGVCSAGGGREAGAARTKASVDDHLECGQVYVGLTVQDEGWDGAVVQEAFQVGDGDAPGAGYED